MCLPGSRDALYVVLPYFNFCGFKKRRDLFVQFVYEMTKTRGIRVVVAEAKGSAPLPKLPVWCHFHVEVPHPIWVKENLINLAVGKFPKDWKFMAWIDADLTFLNQNWAQNAVCELQSYDVVQLFQTAVNLGPNGESLKIDKSFGYMLRDSGTPYTKTDRYGFWHPGYGWACTRKAFEKMHGLVDWAILGSGDRHMAMALIGRVADSAPGNIHPKYKYFLKNFEEDCKGLEVSYVPGTIIHHWHGKFENRRYKERWEILSKNNFDPELDVIFTPEGVLQLSRSGLRLMRDLNGYFLGRREDD
jgi:hypothetical protein